ncbi:hypothetical protein F1880_006919 [Penicillium rolfsii]|nr:hypothetical protein F1880_006919 [Penicillium rolfsii]
MSDLQGPQKQMHERKANVLRIFDPASLLILDKLNEVLTELRVLSSASVLAPVAKSVSLTPLRHVQSLEQGSVEFNPTPSTENVDDLASQEQLFPAAGRTSADAVLRWPVFETQPWDLTFLNHIWATCEGDPVSPDVFPQGLEIRRSSQPLQVCMESAPRLVNDFFRYVHLKNPILEVRTIREGARRLAEDGPQWDANSCLVLLACALGTIANPFDSEPFDLGDKSAHSSSISRDWDKRKIADDYFYLARKRFGLLGRDITACQCYLLSGIYFMYTLRPLQAWSDFSQASATFFVYRKSQLAICALATDQPAEVDRPTRRLEQRLEIRAEIPVPKSGISELHYPYMFPSPPTTPGTPIEGSVQMIGDSRLSLEGYTPMNEISDNLEEQSWFYYLAEIALRRIGNRIVHAFYSSGHESWANFDVAEYIQMTEGFEHELETWQQSLPEPIRFSCPDGSPIEPLNELRFMNRGRYFDLQFMLYRPFLYYAIHNQGDSTQCRLNRYLVQPYAQKALKSCLRRNDGVGFLHRHHGTWYTVRSAVTTILLIIAARTSGRVPVEPLTDYQRAIDLGMRELAFWCHESPGFKQPLVALGRMLKDVGFY